MKALKAFVNKQRIIVNKQRNYVNRSKRAMDNDQ